MSTGVACSALSPSPRSPAVAPARTMRPSFTTAVQLDRPVILLGWRAVQRVIASRRLLRSQSGPPTTLQVTSCFRDVRRRPCQIRAKPVNRGGATLTPMRAPESTELVALDIFARAEVGRTFEIVGTIFTLCGLVNAWRRSTNRIRNAVDVIVEEIKIRVLR